jgi:hypothetical protein
LKQENDLQKTLKNSCLEDYLWLYQNVKNLNQNGISDGLIRKLQALTRQAALSAVMLGFHTMHAPVAALTRAELLLKPNNSNFRIK